MIYGESTASKETGGSADSPNVWLEDWEVHLRPWP
jgi:hypothetical protein